MSLSSRSDRGSGTALSQLDCRKQHPDESYVACNRDEEVGRVSKQAEPGEDSRNCDQHSEKNEPAWKSMRKEASDGYPGCEQAEAYGVGGSAEEEAQEAESLGHRRRRGDVGQ